MVVVSGEVVPLVGIIRDVVEFFIAVGVAEVAPVAGGEGVVAGVERRQHGAVGFQIGIREPGCERGAAEALFGRQAAEFDERGIQIDEAHGLGARFATHGPGAAWWHDDQGHARALSPGGPLAPVLLVAELPAVIAPEHDPGVFSERRGIELLDEATDLTIHEGDAGEVSADGLAPLLMLHHEVVRACGEGIERELPRQRADIIEVIGFHLGRDDLIRGRQRVEVLLRRKERDVRAVVADAEEERLCAWGVELLHGPIRDARVAHLVVADRDGSPVKGLAFFAIRVALARQAIQRQHPIATTGAALDDVARVLGAFARQLILRVAGDLLREGAPALLGLEVIVKVSRSLRVVDLSRAEGFIARGGKVQRQLQFLRRWLALRLAPIAEDTRLIGVATAKHGRA